MKESSDHYELLGIGRDASDDEILAAHRRAASFWHPDRNKAANTLEMMRRVNAARDLLLDPAKRNAYDANTGSRWQQSEADTSRQSGSSRAEQLRQSGQSGQPGQSQQKEGSAGKRPPTPPPSSTAPSAHRSHGSRMPRLALWAALVVVVSIVATAVSGVLFKDANAQSDQLTADIQATRTSVQATATGMVLDETATAEAAKLAVVVETRAALFVEATATQLAADAAIAAETAVILDATATQVAIEAEVQAEAASTATALALSVDNATATAVAIVESCTGTPGMLMFSEAPGDIAVIKDGLVDFAKPTLHAANFDLEVTFRNPLNTPWSYGVLFRGASNGEADAVVIANRDGFPYLSHYKRGQGGAWQFIKSENLYSDVITGPGAQNTLRLIAEGSIAEVFVNEVEVADLRISNPDADHMDLRLIAGFEAFDEPGIVEYDDFTVRCPG